MKNSAPPVKRLKGIEPNYDHMHPFGCLCYVTIPLKQGKGKKKLLTRSRAKAAIFLGYTRTEKQVRVWDFTTSKVDVVRDVKIFERIMPARDSFETYFPSWNKGYEHGFPLAPTNVKMTKEEKEEIEHLENGGELFLEPTSTGEPEYAHSPTDPKKEQHPKRDQPEQHEESTESTAPKCAPESSRKTQKHDPIVDFRVVIVKAPKRDSMEPRT